MARKTIRGNPSMMHPRSAEVSSVRRRSAWIVYFAIAAIVVVAFAFGLMGVMREMSEAHSFTFAQPQVVQAASQVEVEQQDGSLDQVSGVYAAPDPAQLAGRDAEFAVDPGRTDWSFETDGRKTVYLTIDDGPSENTQEVLDILDRYGCKATFFVVGHNDDYFPMIAEAYRRGHTIGLHSLTHDYAQVYSSADAFFEDLDAIGQIVADQIGYVPCFIRFPGGSSNEISADYTPGIMSLLVEEVQERGYQYYDWNLSTGDGADHTAEELVGYTCIPMEDDNIMLLCHDSATKQTTVEALPQIIEYFQEQGYTFEAIDRSSWVCHHGVNN